MKQDVGISTSLRKRPLTPQDAMAAQWEAPPDDIPVPAPHQPIPQPVYTPRPDEAPAPLDSIAFAESTLESLQQELDAAREEVNLLRRRDETLNFYMARLDEELRLAARLQQDFLPKTLPQVGPVHFHTLFRPAGYVSGDLYDLMRLDERHVGFFVTDAVGHGMPAALLTMFIKRALVCKQIDANGYALLPPNETMRRINDAIVEQNLSQATFATAVYGTVNTETLELTLASGGHPAPLLLRGNTLTEVKADGPLLGIFPDEHFYQARTQLEPGDRLLVYSDGLEVAFGEDVASQRGQWRQEILNRLHLSGEQIVVDLAEHLDRESGSLTPKDDLTVVVVEVK